MPSYGLFDTARLEGKRSQYGQTSNHHISTTTPTLSFPHPIIYMYLHVQYSVPSLLKKSPRKEQYAHPLQLHVFPTHKRLGKERHCFKKIKIKTSLL